MANSNTQHAGIPRYRLVYERLRDQILSGQIAPDTRIDTEPVLAKHFDVSIGTVRKAQDLLIQHGLLVKRQGSGTYVTPNAKQTQEILWVCGVDIFNHDISPFYSHFLRYCRSYAAAQGLRVTPVWLSHKQSDESDVYCSPESSRRYMGYIFAGCQFPSHPLLRYAIQNELRNVHIDYAPGRPGKIVIDYPQALQLGIERLRALGHTTIDVLILESQILSYLKRFSMDMSQASRGVRFYGVTAGAHASVVESNGYMAMRHHLAENNPASGLLVMDDILARGATRALLEQRKQLPSGLDVVVLAGLQEAIPVGMPVSYLVHDVEEEARQAIRILVKQAAESESVYDTFVSQFKIMSFEQIEAARREIPVGGDSLIQTFQPVAVS